MRSVVQRVERAEIRVGEKCISMIGKGILVFLGIHQGDEERDADYLSDKIIHLRIFEDDRCYVGVEDAPYVIRTARPALRVGNFTNPM